MSVQNSKSRKATTQDLIAEIFDSLLNVIILFIKLIYFYGESTFKSFFPDPPKSVRGEIVLITGAGHGIGRELAILYAMEGATVVCWDINNENMKQTVQEVTKLGLNKVYSYICDVSNREQVLETADKVKKDVGEVTILINNAGILIARPLTETKPQEIEKTIGINLMAHFWTLEAFLPAMKKNNHGHIVCLSSLAGHIGTANLVPYTASKYAVKGLMEALHQELRQNRQNRIKTTTICPFLVNTGLYKNKRITYESLTPELSPKEVALSILDAQKSNKVEISVPGYFIKSLLFPRLFFPIKACYTLHDTFECVVLPD